MQKLLISLGLDLTEWKTNIARAKEEYKSLVKGVKNGLAKALKGAVTVAATSVAVFGAGELLADHSRNFEKLAKSTKTSSAEMRILREDVYSLNSALGLRSVRDAADKMRMVAKLSRSTGDELKRLTYQTGLLGKEFGSEEDQLTAQIAVMRAFKTSVGEVGDVVAFLNAQGGDIKGELLESIKEYSVQFAEAGFNLDQTVSVLKAGLEKGWNLDKAADTFKEGRLRLMGGKKETVDALELLGLGGLDAQIEKGVVSIPRAMSIIQKELNKLNKTEQFRIAPDIFGSQYEDIGSEAMSAMLSGMNIKLKTSGAIDLLTNDLHARFSYKWDKAVSDSTNSFSRMLDSLKPHILPIVEWFGKAASAVSGFSRQYLFITKTLGAGIAVFMGITLVLGALAMVAGIAGAAFALLTSPITLIIAGVAGVGLGLAFLERKTGLISRSFRAFGEIAVSAWESLKPGLNAVVELGREVWMQFKALGNEVLSLFPSLSSLAGALDFSEVGKTFASIFKTMVIAPIKASLSVFKGLLKIINAVVGIFKDGFDQKNLSLIMEGIGDVFVKPFQTFFKEGIGKLFYNAVSGWGELLYQKLSRPLEKLKNSDIGRLTGFVSAWEAIKPGLTDIIDKGKQLWLQLKLLGAEIADLFPSFDTLRNIAVSAWEAIKPGLTAIFDLGKKLCLMFGRIGYAIADLFPSFKTLRKIANSVWEALKTGLTAIFNFGKKLWLPFGVFTEKLLDLKSVLNFKNVCTAFKYAFDTLIVSPIKAAITVFKGVLKILRGVVGIFKDGFDKNDLKLMLEGINDIFVKPIKEFFSGGLGKLFRNAISNWGELLYGKLSGPFEKMKNSAIGRFLGLGPDKKSSFETEGLPQNSTPLEKDAQPNKASFSQFRREADIKANYGIWHTVPRNGRKSVPFSVGNAENNKASFSKLRREGDIKANYGIWHTVPKNGRKSVPFSVYNAEKKTRKASPRQIRENGTDQPFRSSTEKRYYSTFFEKTDEDKDETAIKTNQTTVHIKHYHGNSRNAAADWDELAYIIP